MTRIRCRLLARCRRRDGPSPPVCTTCPTPHASATRAGPVVRRVLARRGEVFATYRHHAFITDSTPAHRRGRPASPRPQLTNQLPWMRTPGHPCSAARRGGGWTACVVAGTPATRHAHRRPASKAVISNGSTRPAEVRTWPRDPASSGPPPSSVAADTEGPHTGQAPRSTSTAHTAAGGSIDVAMDGDRHGHLLAWSWTGPSRPNQTYEAARHRGSQPLSRGA